MPKLRSLLLAYGLLTNLSSYQSAAAQTDTGHHIKNHRIEAEQIATLGQNGIDAQQRGSGKTEDLDFDKNNATAIEARTWGQLKDRVHRREEDLPE